MAEAATGGAVLVVLPEVFNWRGARHEETAAAEPIPGPTTDYCGELASRFRIHLVAGSLLESGPAPGKVFNTSCVFSPEGRLIGRYRKIHLFDVDLPGRVSVRESDTRAHGDEPVVVATDLGMIGLSICYDLRFPELYRQLSANGATVLVNVAAWPATRPTHWDYLTRARAIENQAFVIAATRAGKDESITMLGRSRVVAPMGDLIVEAGDQEELLIADLELSLVENFRNTIPAINDRREDLFE